MLKTIRLLVCLFLVLSAGGLIVAQSVSSESRPPSAPIIGSITNDRLRFTAPATVVQMHLQVYDNAGQLVFDVSSKGNVLDWTLQDSGGEHLIPGSYLCVVTVKSLSGKLSQRIGSALVQEKQVELQSVEATQLTSAQQQAVGPVEENAALTILKAGEAEAITVIAHDGNEGQVIRSKGALSFRLGDFFTGKDQEQMRLTEEGNLGVGTSEPKAKLDVAGTIRAERVLIAKPKKPSSNSAPAIDTTDSPQPLASGTGTQNQIAKWLDNTGTLGDAGLYENGGLVVIGQNSSGQVAPLAAISGQYHILEVGVPPGGKSPLTLAGGSGVMEFWKDLGGGVAAPAAAVSFGMAVPGTPATNDMLFSSYTAGNPWNERMRLTNAGNVGIGTASPRQLLHVNSAGGNAAALVQTPSGFFAQYQLQSGANNSWIVGTQDNFAGNALLFRNGSTDQMAIQPNGNVGIGTLFPTVAKLVVQDTSIGTAVSGTTSTNGSGVFGQSTSAGGYGVFGTNASGWGVYGTSAGFSYAGVAGVSTAQSGIGVYGKATGAGAVGVIAESAQGFAIDVRGNAHQQRDKGGLVKAMLYVSSGGNIHQCYNGLTGASASGISSPDGCGFHVTHDNIGIYNISFGFGVSDRFYALSAEHEFQACIPDCSEERNKGANFNFFGDANSLQVVTFFTDQRLSITNGAFMLVVF